MPWTRRRSWRRSSWSAWKPRAVSGHANRFVLSPPNTASRRTFVRLRGLEICGGDMNIVRVDLATDDRLWERLLAARKSVWRQASLVGWDTLFLLLLRRLELDAAVRRVSRRLRIRGRAHLFPHAEAG